MTTLPPIQPRPILCKTPSNPSQSSSLFLIHSLSQQPSNVNNNTNSDLSNNNNISSLPLSSYEEFLKRLREFHRVRQTTFRCLPTIAGQIVDLQLLYNTVVAHGGWEKVNDRQLWSTVALSFGIDSTCLNGTQALKNIYIRFLYAFEKISNGENIDSRDDDDEDSKRRNVSQLQRVPQSYNHSQHNISDSLRAQYGLFRDFIRRNEYEKLELALLCGFPNELTFSLNTLLLISSTTINNPNFLHLYKCPRLLDILYSHIGLLSSINEHYFQILHENLWTKHVDYQMEHFWSNFCSKKIVQQLFHFDEIHQNSSQEYFNLNSNNQQQEQELRIEQILMILRNLSFERTNAIYLLEKIHLTSSLTYKFFVLISYCEKKIELQKYVFDIWTNLASYMNIRLINNDEGLLFRQLLNQMLVGSEDNHQQDDRFKIIRALEILSNLAQAGNNNGIYLIDFIDIIIKKYLHIEDILILVHSLECLYQLTELGEFLCNSILKIESSRSIITTLIDLLTIEARSFSSQTIKTIKIVEMSNGPALIQSYNQPPSLTTQQTANISQSVVVIPSNQQQTYAIENTEINKTYYSNNNKLIIQQQQQQQYVKPMTVANVISSGNLLAVTTPTTSTPIIVANTNLQANQNADKKRKHDSISETIAAVVNGTTSSPSPSPVVTPPPPKRARPSRARATPTKNNVVIAPIPPPRLNPSLSIEDDTSSMESTSTSNSIHSTMADLLDRCSSPPSLEQEIRSCLNDLCQRVASNNDEPLISLLSNPISSPVFKRKIDEQTSTNKATTPKKKRNRSSSTKKSAIDTSNTPKKEEPIEPEIADIKPPISTPNIIQSTNTSDYVCEWDSCRKSFQTARAVFHHACSAHVKYSADYICLWNGCDRIKRQKWALISHIQERHCSEAAFRQAKFKATNSIPSTTANTNTSSPAITTPTTNTSSTTGAVGYAPDAAWLAVRRHMQMSSFDDLLIKSKEGPLTKSIRLTAALILRNLARHSSVAKQHLRQYEQHLTNLALESNEASNTISSCLFELYT